MSKSRQVFHIVKHNITNFQTIIDIDWQSHFENLLDKPITHEITVLVKDLLTPLAEKTRENASEFEKVLKEEIFDDIQYVESLEKELDTLQSDKDEFSNEYDLLLQEYLKAQLQDTNTAIGELKKLVEKMKGKGMDTNFGKPSILGKPPLQPLRNQPVVRQPAAFKSERSLFLKTRFASQVVEKNDFTKPVTLHSWPHVRQFVFAKPYHVNAPDPSRNSLKRVSFQSLKESVGSNDMIPIGQQFSPNKSSDVYVKIMPPRSGLTWKPTDIIFSYVSLRWIPTKKSVETCINTNDSALTLGKETCTSNTVICANSSSLNAGTSMAFEPISSKGSTNVNIIPSSTLVQTSIID
ncbi:hypothetical protein Tco_1004940 [Tanacetum coccineum]|uniref:Uncharacterized protein n=1 Tax=Tanacetum coccineum TaxID=301880 RepID=A0ABQ5FF74_9ASTR